MHRFKPQDIVLVIDADKFAMRLVEIDKVILPSEIDGRDKEMDVLAERYQGMTCSIVERAKYGWHKVRFTNRHDTLYVHDSEIEERIAHGKV